MLPSTEDQPNATAKGRGPAVFTFAGTDVAAREIILAAFIRGELDLPWRRTLAGICAQEQAVEQALEPDEAAIQTASDEFRYARDLVAAEDTERWLEARELTLDDFGEFFERAYWRERLAGHFELPATTYSTASDEARDLLRVDLWLTDAMESIARAHTWRLTAAATTEPPPPAATAAVRERWSAWIEAGARLAASNPRFHVDATDWFQRLIAAEAAFERCRDEALTEDHRRQTLGRLRPALLRLDCEIMELESEDAAREAFLCVRDDRIPMDRLAREARYPFARRLVALEEVPHVAAEIMLSVPPGTVLEPWPRGEGFQLCRVCHRVEPDLADPAIRDRIDGEILPLHFGELAPPHLRWLIGSAASA